MNINWSITVGGSRVSQHWRFWSNVFVWRLKMTRCRYCIPLVLWTWTSPSWLVTTIICLFTRVSTRFLNKLILIALLLHFHHSRNYSLHLQKLYLIEFFNNRLHLWLFYQFCKLKVVLSTLFQTWRCIFGVFLKRMCPLADIGIFLALLYKSVCLNDTHCNV